MNDPSLRDVADFAEANATAIIGYFAAVKDRDQARKVLARVRAVLDDMAPFGPEAAIVARIESAMDEPP